MTTAKTPTRWPLEEWVTVSVTAAPTGWRNVFASRDPQEPLEEMAQLTPFTAPCPAFLLQELRSTEWVYRDGTEAQRQIHGPPHHTRAVPAALDDLGDLEPARDALNYLGPLAPGEDLATRYPSTNAAEYA